MSDSIDWLRENSFKLYELVKEFRKRWIFHKINSKLGSEPRIKLVRGFRGTGKTTLLLQLFGEHSERSIYINADNPKVKREGLYQIGSDAIERGYDILLIDEAHTFIDWRSHIKALYDENPNASFVVSGSAPLVFSAGRRETELNMEFLSLSEFIYLMDGTKVIASDDVWKDPDATLRFIARNPSLSRNWDEYIRSGLPLFFSFNKNVSSAVFNSIKKSIREDALYYLNMSGEKITAMESMLYMIATSSLGEFSVNSASKNLGISKYTAYEIINTLESMQIIRIVRPYGKGPKLVRGEPKVMFSHPAMRIAVCEELGEDADLGAVREEIAVFSLINRGYTVNTIKGAKRSPDYIVRKGKTIFLVEVGGESKTKKQLLNMKLNGIIIKPRQLITLSAF